MARKSDIIYVNFLVEGSTARAVEPTPKKQKAELPKAPKAKKLHVVHLDVMAVAGIAVSVLMAAVLMFGFIRLQAIEKEAARMESYVYTLQNENTELRYAYQKSYDLEKVQKTAESMGYISLDSVEKQTLVLPVIKEPIKEPLWQRFVDYIRDLFV